MTCRTKEDMVEERIDRVLTQYRESPNLLFMFRTYLRAAANAYNVVCDLPDKFDIETAVGDQLTLIGKRLGWPRSHCVCETQPVFGFECEQFPGLQHVEGFCDSNVTWDGCNSGGIGQISILDDETYRKFLKVRRFQLLGLFDLANLEKALQIFFGLQARVLYAGQGRIVISPGRDLTSTEIALIQLYPRSLPIALGIEVRFHFGILRVFGFGEGWGGFQELQYPTDENYLQYGRIFGFCEDPVDEGELFGFCVQQDRTYKVLQDGLGNSIVATRTDRTKLLMRSTTGNSGPGSSWLCPKDADWMCEVDVQPYSC